MFVSTAGKVHMCHYASDANSEKKTAMGTAVVKKKKHASLVEQSRELISDDISQASQYSYGPQQL